MKQKLGRWLVQVGSYFLSAGNSLVKPHNAEVYNAWFRDKGDKTHRLDYDLRESSIVFDLGGYEGQWASDIFSRYICRIFIFEPVAEFASNIQERFTHNGKISVHEFGLGGRTANVSISMGNDASSVYRAGGAQREIRIVRAMDFLTQGNIVFIDLMKINIEGGEYDLLDHLIETGYTTKIANIQVQFHDIVPHAEQRMRAIQNKLHKTHALTYQYPFVWENWTLLKKEQK